MPNKAWTGVWVSKNQVSPPSRKTEEPPIPLVR